MPIIKTIQWMSWSIVLFLTACPGGKPLLERDGGIDGCIDADVDAQAIPEVGEVHELDLLPAIDPEYPFNHSTEPSVALHGDDVVVLFINLALDSTDSFDSFPLHYRRVAAVYSHDGGKTYSQAVDPGLGDRTSDPVVRVSDKGIFFATVVDPEKDVVLGRSDDGGETWRELARVPGYDKEWLALSNDPQRAYVGATQGSWVFDWSGEQMGFCGESMLCGNLHNGGYADQDGVHFAIGGGRAWPLQIVSWDGASAPTQEGSDLPMGTSDAWNNVSVSLGATLDQRQWIVRAVETGSFHQVMVRVRDLPEDEGVDQPVSPPNAHAFIPAATRDDMGRLYVVWYETGSNPTGVLKLTRSLTADFSQGFEDPIIVDDDACPGQGWFPATDDPNADDRRLREYIDIAVTGTRAHIVWTHAPGPPARVRTLAVQFPD